MPSISRRSTIPRTATPAYARARLRSEAATLARLGLDRAALARLARRAARAEAALEAETTRVEAAVAPVGGTMALDGHRHLEPEILLRLVRRAVERVAAPAGPLRLERLETLVEALAAALREGRPHRATLGRARIALDPDAMLAVAPAPPRRRGRRSKDSRVTASIKAISTRLLRSLGNAIGRAELHSLIVPARTRPTSLKLDLLRPRPSLSSRTGAVARLDLGRS